MSQPKRFDFWMYQKPCEHFGIRATMQMEFSENGRCVSWDDYAALSAEYVEVKDLHLKCRIDIGNLHKENERLKAEVEWLRKADRLVCWNPATQAWEVRHEAHK